MEALDRRRDVLRIGRDERDRFGMAEMIRRIAAAFVFVMAFLILVASIEDVSSRPTNQLEQ